MRTFEDGQKAAWDEVLANVDYSFVTEPKGSDDEVYGVEVVGIAGTDREGEAFHYRFQEGESLDHLMRRVVWERSWDGYSPLAEYIERNPQP